MLSYSILQDSVTWVWILLESLETRLQQTNAWHSQALSPLSSGNVIQMCFPGV